MNYKILTIPPFDRQLKTLAKKYSSKKHKKEDISDKELFLLHKFID